MDKIDYGTHSNIMRMSTGDDMHVLNVLVEQVRGLLPVSGNAQELGLPDPELFDELGAELL